MVFWRQLRDFANANGGGVFILSSLPQNAYLRDINWTDFLWQIFGCGPIGMAGEFAPGVHGAPNERKLLDSWLAKVKALAQYTERV